MAEKNNDDGCLLFGLLIVIGGVTCNMDKKVDYIHEQTIQERDFRNQLREYSLRNRLYLENVIGGPAPEKFYVIEGKRVYLEIDGKPVEEYWKGK